MGNYVIPEDALREQAAKDGVTHVSTGVAVIRNGKLLLVHREPKDFMGGNYELPGGGVDPGETLAEGVKREIREETGLTVTNIVGMFPGFDYSGETKPKVRQFNFIVEAEGEIKLSFEHDGYKWVSEDDVADLTMSDEMRTCVSSALQHGR